MPAHTASPWFPKIVVVHAIPFVNSNIMTERVSELALFLVERLAAHWRSHCKRWLYNPKITIARLDPVLN